MNEMSVVTTNFNLWTCMMGSDSWGEGSGEKFGDFVCLVLPTMSSVPPDSEQDRKGRFEGGTTSLVRRHPSLTSSLTIFLTFGKSFSLAIKSAPSALISKFWGQWSKNSA